MNNYTNFHKKSSKSNFILNKVTALTNTTAANFWVEYKGLVTTETVSPKYKQRVQSDYTKLSLYSSLDQGANVRLVMENANLSTLNAFVSGDVSF